MSQTHKIIGRTVELGQLTKGLELQRNILIEGPVGVGKTFLVQSLLQKANKQFERVDGDTRYTEQKLTGWFDPPLVLKQGYVESSFIDGPLVTAMKEGRVLFINELNRMPEAVQNILLPAMDERHIRIPKIGEIKAKSGFLVVATQNPQEFTATHALSEALLDRFEMIRLGYQSKEDELQILKSRIKDIDSKTYEEAINIVRATREHASIKRGASIRAAQAICELVRGGISFKESCMMALPSRIELMSSDDDATSIISELLGSPELDLAEKKSQQL